MSSLYTRRRGLRTRNLLALGWIELLVRNLGSLFGFEKKIKMEDSDSKPTITAKNAADALRSVIPFLDESMDVYNSEATDVVGHLTTILQELEQKEATEVHVSQFHDVRECGITDRGLLICRLICTSMYDHNLIIGFLFVRA